MQTKSLEQGNKGAFKDDYFSFTGKTLDMDVQSLADVCSYTLKKLKRFSYHGIPYKFSKHYFCSEMRDWTPPPMNKCGVEYHPTAYALSSGLLCNCHESESSVYMLVCSYIHAGQFVNVNDHFVSEGESSEILIVGFLRTELLSIGNVIVLVPPTKLHELDPKSVSQHLFVCEISTFVSTYITDWLVSNVYNDEYRHYTPKYLGDEQVSIIVIS